MYAGLLMWLELALSAHTWRESPGKTKPIAHMSITHAAAGVVWFCDIALYLIYRSAAYLALCLFTH